MSESKDLINILINGKTTILCSINDKIEEIIIKYGREIKKDIINLYCCYNGTIIKDKKKKIENVINRFDRERKEMSIIVLNLVDTLKENKFKESNDTFCLQCKENIFIKINDYLINTICNNGHKNRNIKFSEFQENQKILCEICK